MLRTEYFSEDTMEDLAEALDEFLSGNDIDDEGLVDIQYNFRKTEAMLIYNDDN